MKYILVICFLLIYSCIHGQDKQIQKRLDYLAVNPIFVTQIDPEDQLLLKDNIESISDINKINSNLRTTFNSFWNLSDTIIYFNNAKLESLKKLYKESAFFALIKVGETNNKAGELKSIFAYKLDLPKKIKYEFGTLLSLKSSDTLHLNIITEVRKLILIMKTGYVLNQKDLGEKTILIDRVPPPYIPSLEYWSKVKQKYQGKYKEASYSEILRIVLTKDPRFIYVHHGSTYNAEDGSMIPLLY